MNNSKKRISFSIFIKFIFINSFFLIIVLSSVGIFLTNFQEKSLLEEKLKSNKVITELLANISSGPIERSAYFALEEHSIKLQSDTNDDSDILSVIFYDNDSKKLNPSGVEHNKILLPKEQLNIQESFILSEQKETIGRVVVVFSLESIYIRSKNAKNTSLIVFIIGVILLDGVIILMLSIIITRPLKRLTNAAKQITKGDFDINIKCKSKDEIGFLSNSFVEMSREIKQNFAEIEEKNREIKEYNEHLEDMVKSRTKELDEANKKLIEEEEALIRFTTELNEQTMSIGKIEKELEHKNELLNNANEELTLLNANLFEELKMAKRVQENIIPDETKFPKRREISLSSEYLSMETIGGDLYDVIKIKNNLYGFLIADVSGHGIPAALITTMAKVSFTTYSQKEIPPDEVCKNVNRDFMDLIGDLVYYLTAYYGVLDLETGLFQYTNAGHHAALHYIKRTGEIKKLDSQGNLIGAYPFDVEFGTNQTILEDGDRVLLFTDGIVEAKDPFDQLYGYGRLYEYIYKNSYLQPKEFVKGLIRSVDAFCDGRPPDDDRAILYFEFHHKNSQNEIISVEKAETVNS